MPAAAPEMAPLATDPAVAPAAASAPAPAAAPGPDKIEMILAVLAFLITVGAVLVLALMKVE